MRPDRIASQDEAPSDLLSAASIQQAVVTAGLEPLTDVQAERFSTYAALLQRWNAHLNLTALRSPQQILERHFIECIYCAQHLINDPSTLLDFGSGAGFPGIPIAICHPEIDVTLSESTAKKASFLSEAVRRLGLSATIFSGRVEAMPPQATFDAVTLRAVDKMELALPTAPKRLNPGGVLVLMTTIGAKSIHPLDDLVQINSQPLPHSSGRILAQYRKP